MNIETKQYKRVHKKLEFFSYYGTSEMPESQVSKS